MSALRVADDCWNRIGVSGDQSCPELATHVHCRNCPVFAAAARTFFDRPAPEGYLNEWGALLGGEASIDGAASFNALIFRIGAEWLALATSCVVEVTASKPVRRIPHRSNAILAGLVNLRGQLLLCVSLHGLLGVATAAGPNPRPRMVVIRGENQPWAFEADEVAGVHRIALDRLRNVPSTLANPAVSFSQAVFAHGRHSVGYLDEGRIFAGLGGLGQ